MSIISLLIASFGGGIFGAAVGCVIAFILFCFMLIVALAAHAAGAEFLGTGNFLNVALAFFGPHTGGFAAGIAAAAYAGYKKKIETGRDIVTPLMGLHAPDVLIVGGLFGLGGHLLNWGFVSIGLTKYTDTIALTVVLSAMAARLLWGNGILGKVPAGDKRYRPKNPWIPWQSGFLQLIMIGLGMGIFSSVVALSLGTANNGNLYGFAISGIIYIWLCFGLKVPITHHITLVSALAATLSGNLYWGIIFGVIAAVVGEFFANTFCTHGNTNIDPPATTIAVLTSLIFLLKTSGML